MRLRHLSVFMTLLFFSAGIFAQTLTTLYDFGSSSTAPSGFAGALVHATDGNFYGTTTGGGVTPGYGTIFKMTPNGTLNVIYSLCSNGETTLCVSTGAQPNGIIQASDGNFYGTTRGGGTHGLGTVFKVTPAGIFTVLHSFCASCNEGSYPDAALVQGTDGSLYGTTPNGSDGAGGTNPYGSIYKITLSGTLTTLYTFCPTGMCTDGQQPSSPLVVGSDGDLYGVTSIGGVDNSFPNGYLGGGTLFKITPSGAFTVLHQFCSTAACADGTGPNSLVLGKDGAIYGTTSGGIYDSSDNVVGFGTAFKFSAAGVLTTLHTFCTQPACPDGGIPRGGLVQANDGNFYGTAFMGGVNETTQGAGGTVFRMTPSGIVTPIYAFCAKPGGSFYCLDGWQPDNGLVQGASGVVYGVTSSGGDGVDGGDYGAGTIFSLSLPSAPKTSVAAGALADYLGENNSGYTVWRAATGYWYSIDGAGGSVTAQFGAPTDLPVIGDFDGDGKSDFAVYRPTTGFWYIKRSSDQQVESQQFGAATDMPVAGDFDGDGKTDLVVYRPATGFWYIARSSDKSVEAKQFGEATDVPVVGDFDGDGKSDVAVFRPGTGYWYITQSSTNTVVAKQWGAATDIPVSGDFDGDGKTDIAVYRPSTGYWYIIQSSNGRTVAKQWGAVGDVPVARDYDGDGKTDIAVWRPSTGYWYVVQSSFGQTRAQQWGAATDIPVNHLER